MRTLILLAMVAALSTTACKDGTGVLISVTAEDTVDDIEFLRFYIGQDVIGEPDYFAETDPIAGVPHPMGEPGNSFYIEVSAEDFREHGYDLLIRPKDSSSPEERIAVAVLGYLPGGDWPVAYAAVPEPVTFEKGKIIKWNIVLQTSDVNFRAEDNCLKWRMPAPDDLPWEAGEPTPEWDGEWMHVGTGDDLDCDGRTEEENDCNDLNPYQRPGRAEICDNEIDDDCNDLTDLEDADIDGDGYFVCPPADAPKQDRDCNDGLAYVHPDADELCNGKDDNCNKLCDEDLDLDGDGLTDCGSVIDGDHCAGIDPLVYDCDEEDAENFMGNSEKADGKDNNCNGECDEDPSLDGDLDGFTAWGPLGVCSGTDALGDCDIGDPDIYPGAPEYCDGIDNDCSGGAEVSRVPCFYSADIAGTCFATFATCNFDGLVAEVGSCEVPGVEVDGGICSVYDQCMLEDDLKCIYNALPVTTALCTTYLTEQRICSDGAISLATTGAVGGCAHKLLSDSNTDRYQVGLRVGEQTTNLSETNACNTSLHIQPTLQSEATIIRVVSSVNDTDWQLRKVLVTTELVESCDGLEFHCTPFE